MAQVSRLERAALYRRLSGSGQTKSYSLQTQEEGILKYCQEHGYTVNPTHDYVDIKTGVIYREREQLSVLRAAARRCECDVVVVYDLDRFSRDPIQQMIVIEDLNYYRVRVECVLREIDNSPEGQLILFSQGYAAKLEHERFLERSSRGRQAKIESGKPIGGGKALYGYQWADKEKTAYVINLKIVYVDENGTSWREADVIVHIFGLADQGHPLNRITAALNEAHISTPRGERRWSSTTVRKILKNPYYIGKAVAFKWKVIRDAGYRRIVTHRSEEEQVQLPLGIVPALINVEIFERVQERLQLNKEQGAYNNSRPEEALLRRGLVICGYCGVNKSVSRNRPNYITYSCSMWRKGYGTEECRGLSISAHKLDTAFRQRTVEIIQEPLVVKNMLEIRRQKDTTPEELCPIDSILEKIAYQINNYRQAMDKTENNTIMDNIIVQLKRLADEQRELEEMRDKLMAEQEVWKKTSSGSIFNRAVL